MIITKKSLEEGEASSTAISYSVNSKFWLQIFGRGTFLVPALAPTRHLGANKGNASNTIYFIIKKPYPS